MIIYKNILKRLSANGWTTLRLQKEKMISNGTIIQIRAGKPVTTKTIDTICKLCKCEVGDVIEYVPDMDEEGE